MPHLRETPARFTRSALLLAVATLVSALPLAAGAAGSAGSSKPAITEGVFTGEITPAGPVYRLPTIVVRANRKAELARIEAEDKRAAAERMRVAEAAQAAEVPRTAVRRSSGH